MGDWKIAAFKKDLMIHNSIVKLQVLDAQYNSEFMIAYFFTHCHKSSDAHKPS